MHEFTKKLMDFYEEPECVLLKAIEVMTQCQQIIDKIVEESRDNESGVPSLGEYLVVDKCKQEQKRAVEVLLDLKEIFNIEIKVTSESVKLRIEDERVQSRIKRILEKCGSGYKFNELNIQKVNKDTKRRFY